MDTIHDLGGRQGFGPIPNVTEDDSALFEAAWKARVWAIAMISMDKLHAASTGWTLDWYRHVLERLPPDLYVRLDYFEKWTLAMMATAVDEGIADPAEFADGHANSQRFDYSPVGPLKEVPAGPARFGVGDKVSTLRDVEAAHTRLCGYLRGRTGVIDRTTGPQPVPDAAADGTIINEQVYVVRFRMADLWPEAVDSSDSLLVEIWDRHLEPA